jgi:hypothetical protein
MPRLQSQPNCLIRAGFLIAALASTLLGAEQRTAADRVRERVLRMTEFFDTMLPGVLEQHNMTLHVRPKFSDLRDYEYCTGGSPSSCATA